MLAPTPRAAIDGFVAAMGAKDLDTMLRLVTDDILLIGSEGHEVARGHDEVRALLSAVSSLRRGADALSMVHSGE